MSAPGRADVERELVRARTNLDLADAAGDDTERHGRLAQAAQALSNAGRITDGLARAIEPPQPNRWASAMNFGGAPPARAVLAGPAPR